MKTFLQTSKSTAADAIKTLGLKDLSKNAAAAAAGAALQSVISSTAKTQQPLTTATSLPSLQPTPPALAPEPQIPSSSSFSFPPPAFPYYPPYPYYPSPQFAPPREPFYPQTKIGASRVNEIVPGRVAEADLHHIGSHPYPFYKQKWFIVLIIVVVIGIIVGIVVGIILYVRHKDNSDPNLNVPGIPA